MRLVSSLALITRSTSMPSTRGIFRSSRTRRGAPACRPAKRPSRSRKSSASCPSCSQTIWLATFCSFRPRIVSSASSGLSSTRRISTSSSSCMSGLLGQREVERRALVGLAVGPDSPAVAYDDALHQSEPHAGAAEFAFAVQPLEHAKQLRLVARIEACAVVADVVDELLLVADRADLHDGPLPLARILDRVGEQIGPHLLEQRAIAQHWGQRREAKLGARAVELRPYAVEHRASERGHVDLDPLERLAAQPGEGKQVVDQRAHALRFALDDSELSPPLVIELGRVVLPEHAREAGDRPHRRPQVMGHRIAEALQLLVRGLELRRPLSDTLLELGIEPLQLLLGAALVFDVANRADPFLDLAVEHDRNPAHADVAMAVRASVAQAQFELERGTGGGRAGPSERQRAPILRVEGFLPTQPRIFVDVLSRIPGPRLLRLDELSDLVAVPHDSRDRRGERPVALLAHAERLLGVPALLDLPRQDLVRCLEHLGAPFDLREHFVEAVHEIADLVGRGLGRAQAEIASLRDLAGDAADREDGLDHDGVQPRRHQYRDREAYQADRKQDRDVALHPLDELVVRPQVDRSQDLAVVGNSLEHRELSAFDAEAFAFGQRRERGRRVLRRVLREDRTVGRIDGGGRDLRPRLEHRQILARRFGIAKRQRGRAGAAEYVGLRHEILDPRSLIGAHVVIDERHARHDERSQRRGDHDEQQLVPDRACGGEHGQGFPVRTFWATLSSRELSFRPRRSASSTETSNRTRSSTTMKLIVLPEFSAPSLSVTTRIGAEATAARLSAASCARATKSTWMPSTELSSLSRLTSKLRPRRVRSLMTSVSSATSGSSPITAIVTGVSARGKTRSGHST